MAWVAVDKNGTECLFSQEPSRGLEYCKWRITVHGVFVELPQGTIKKLIGRELNWSDESVKLE